MMGTARQTISKTLIALVLTWMVNCCASSNTSHQETPQEPPAQVKPEPIVEQVTPSEAVPPPSVPEPRLYEHIVRWPGESLSYIAQWYTGDANNWKVIVEANPGLNPNRIFIGDHVFIPEDLLKKRKQMPRHFLPSSVPRKDVQPLPVDQAPKEPEETQLFGPVE